MLGGKVVAEDLRQTQELKEKMEKEQQDVHQNYEQAFIRSTTNVQMVQRDQRNQALIREKFNEKKDKEQELEYIKEQSREMEKKVKENQDKLERAEQDMYDIEDIKAKL